MKKLAIGCGMVVVLLVLAGVGGAYWMYRKVSSTVNQFAELGEAPKLEQQVRNTSRFMPPDSGELTDKQIERLVQVQARVRARLGEGAKQFESQYHAFLEKKDATALDVPALLAAYRDLAKLWMDAKRTQVEALNAAGFSLDEYRWVRREAYRAAGIPFVEIDFARIADGIKTGHGLQGDGAPMNATAGPGGPEGNRRLIEPVKKQLESNVALATFGL